MMYLKTQDTIKALIKLKKTLLGLPSSLDPELIAEAPCYITFQSLSEDTSIPNYNGKTFILNYDYQSLIFKDNEFINNELDHYQNLLNDEVMKIIGYLRAYPLSKRAIIDVWTKEQRNLDNQAECLIYMLFRKTSDGLDMHVHMRANNAADKALLNFHIFAAIQRFVAKELNLPMGTYHHICDSYHLYR